VGIFKKWKITLIAWFCISLIGVAFYYELWGSHLYIVTAYCNCPICINVKEFHDGKFANGEKVSWGAVAAPKQYRFGTKIELVPTFPWDYWRIQRVLNNRTKFIVKDRGGKIRGKHIDLFIPDTMGGHKAALRWGRQMMRLKIDGKLAE